ncbi:hypothetical protein [Streptomyces sp. NPDC001410]|uniref:hypothetical protein n=1 Tax=Streptomyces sp. NPDC001410 TaxID=3364574 RepID=UPI0036B2617A
MELLAPDVTCWSDGGGKVTAARRPLYGPDHVARWILGVPAKPQSAGITLRQAVVNGELGILFTLGEMPVAALTYDMSEGAIRNLRLQVNPEKLTGLRPSRE